MKKKPTELQDHVKWAAQLRSTIETLQSLRVEVSHAYPFGSKQCKSLDRALRATEQVRCVLDGVYFASDLDATASLYYGSK